MQNNFPATSHRKSYPAISPLRPELSQGGKTILICGGSTGIGFSIARAFCAAGASKVIIVGRRADALTKAADALSGEHSATNVTPKVADVFSLAESDKLWEDLGQDKGGMPVDVLIFNAVHYPAFQPVMEQGTLRLWEDFETNVRMPVYHAEKLYKQANHTSKKCNIFISSRVIANQSEVKLMPGYLLTKSAATCAMQHIARDVPADKMQIISMHPGAILTDAAKGAGYTEDTFPWDHEDLPGHFAVWAASPEAAFLHGRYVWSNWDVEDLSKGEIRDKIDSDPWYLTVGINGV